MDDAGVDFAGIAPQDSHHGIKAGRFQRALGSEFDLPVDARGGLQAETDGLPFLIPQVLRKLLEAVELDPVDG